MGAASESNLTLRVHVAARAAILAGKTKMGSLSVEIRPEDLAGLTQDQREEIVRLHEGAPELGTLANDVPLAEPTVKAMIPAIDARVAQRRAAEESARAQQAEADERAIVTEKTVSLRDASRERALRDWVSKNGDDDQKARLAEGYLRPDEILRLVTDDLLDMPHQEYEPLRRGDACDCPCAGSVEFKVGAPSYLDSAQFAKLKQIREDAPEGAKVEPVEHLAKCPKCSCLPLSRLTARVSLEWHGWLIRKDFSLR